MKRGFSNFIQSLRPLPVPRVNATPIYTRDSIWGNPRPKHASIILNAEGSVALSNGAIVTEEEMNQSIKEAMSYDFT